MNNKNQTAVYLGRFCPLHKGHQLVVEAMVSKFGVENSLLIIGSSNSYNTRTPFTFEERKAMAKRLYPNLKVLPLPDTNPSLIIYSDSTNGAWLESIKRIESHLNTSFIFFGGSEKDLEVLKMKFPTQVSIDRKSTGLDISGTKIRDALDAGDLKALDNFVDKKIISDVVTSYNKFKDNHKNGNGS